MSLIVGNGACGRVEYDLERAMAGIRASELPYEFAEYLRTGGKSPSPATA
ncbi:MAG TPA: hypothetical protein VFX42_00565 [Gemmatimonadales bacterium]|nr:hypothetical protein [Gemmatimonadales bacterium]